MFLRKAIFGTFLLTQVTFATPALAAYTDGLSDAGSTGGFATTQTLPQLVGMLIEAVLGILGIIFLVLIIYAGFTWMTAAGDEKKVGKAKDILISATVGLVITVSAWSISNFVIKALQNTTNAVVTTGE